MIINIKFGLFHIAAIGWNGLRKSYTVPKNSDSECN